MVHYFCFGEFDISRDFLAKGVCLKGQGSSGSVYAVRRRRGGVGAIMYVLGFSGDVGVPLFLGVTGSCTHLAVIFDSALDE